MIDFFDLIVNTTIFTKKSYISSLHFAELNISLSEFIFRMTSCRFIHDFSIIILWASSFVISIEHVRFLWSLTIRQRYIIYVIECLLNSSLKSLIERDLDRSIDFMSKISQICIVKSSSIAIYTCESMSISAKHSWRFSCIVIAQFAINEILVYESWSKSKLDIMTMLSFESSLSKVTRFSISIQR